MGDDGGVPGLDQIATISRAMRAQLIADGKDDPGADWSKKMTDDYGYGQKGLVGYLEGVNASLANPNPPLSDAVIATLAANDANSTLDNLRTDIALASG
jgi:hypothetical protein